MKIGWIWVKYSKKRQLIYFKTEELPLCANISKKVTAQGLG